MYASSGRSRGSGVGGGRLRGMCENNFEDARSENRYLFPFTWKITLNVSLGDF